MRGRDTAGGEEGPVEGERRLLTVVCCALTATGPGLATSDVEELDELFGAGQAICAQVARRHQGRMAVGFGNQVLLHFDDPVAHETDALRAARAAREVAAEIGTWSAWLSAERGIAFDLRIGIHAGIVVAREGHEGGRHFGWTPQVAAQLSALAAPGSIVASRDVHRILSGRFELEETTAHLPDGGAVYRLQEEVVSGCPELEKMPLFGREQEIGLLLQRWGQARQGAGQVVLVTGASGIGKTRLTLELLRRLRGEAHICLEARCTPERRSFRPILDVLERLLDRGYEEAPEGRLERLERLEGLLSRRGFSLVETVPLLAELLSIPTAGRYPAPTGSPQRRKERTFQVLLSLLFEMAADEQPILLMIEDLHWADAMTIEWLGALARDVPSARVMALFTARPELSLPWPTSGMLQIQLARLDRGDVERMVAQVAGGRALPAAVIEQIVRRADGVPLFVEELSRMVIESGALREEEGRYVLAHPLSDLAIPTTLQGLLVARLDRLGRARKTAQLAAALGREFSQEVLAAVCACGEAEVQEDLDELAAADLALRRRRVRGSTWMFKHALIRDAAYASIPKRARPRVHARIAQTLEERFPEIVRTRPEVLMFHHAAAEQKRQAIVYAERAAEGALARPTGADAAEARELLDRALGWLTAIEDERERALTELRLNSLLSLAVLGRRGYGAEVAAVVVRCRSLIDRLGESALTTPISLATFFYHHVQGQRREARSLAERFAALAARSRDTDQLIWAPQLLAQCLCNEGRFMEAREQLERVLSQYTPAAHRRHAFLYGLDVKVYAQSSLSWLLDAGGEPDRALAEAQAAVAWARELDHPNTLGLALLYLALAHYFGREREKTAAVAGDLIALAERYRLWSEEHGRILRSWAQGDLEGAEQHVEALRSSGSGFVLAYYDSLPGELQAERGQHAAAIARFDRCLQAAGRMDDTIYVPELCRLEALSLWALGDRAGSEAYLRRAVALAHEQGARLFELRSILALCRELEEEQRRDEARALLREPCGWPAAHAAMPELAEARALLGALGDPG